MPNILRNARNVQAVKGFFCSKTGSEFDAQLDDKYPSFLNKERVFVFQSLIVWGHYGFH